MRDGSSSFSNDHGFEFVSYIYGELDQTARDAFESHLAGCDECAMELASYSDARLGVIEWRREDFDHLETPAIVVPWASDKQAVVETKPVGIVSRFIEKLSAFPMFAKAGLGLAAAALAVGVYYFAPSAPLSQRNVASSLKTENSQPSSAPENKTSEGPESQFVANGEEKPSTIEKKNIDARPSRLRNATVARVSTRPAVRRSELATASTSTNFRLSTKKAPRLTSVDEDDDKSLRLADLFAEIGSSEE